jgi:hypothetical protein
VDAKSIVQDIIRSIPNLSKLPSGRDIIDIRNSYILKKYKQEMGPVSFSLDWLQLLKYFATVTLGIGILRKVHV